MSATTTLRGHVSRALDFFERNDIYFAIGKEDAWPDEDAPSAPDINAATLDGLIGAKKVETVNLVVPDANGSIIYRDSKWRTVSPSEALTAGARWVLIETWLRYDELPITDYRQVGVFSRLVKADSVPAGKLNLLPTVIIS